MSIFGNVAPVQVPDFGQTLARAQGMQANRLAMLAQQRQMDERDRLNQFFQQHGGAFATADPRQQLNLLAMMAQTGTPGAQLAFPQMQPARDALEWSGGNAHAAAATPAVARPGGGDYTTRLIADESSGDPNARNPRSSATGTGQFIDSTWLQFAGAHPELFQGMSRDQILAARTNPDLSRRAIEWYRDANSRHLSALGLPANDGTVALAHRFGPQGAASLLRADPNAPVASVVGEQVMAANPDLAGRTVGQVVGRYAQRFGGGGGSGDTIPASGGGGPAPAPSAPSGLPAVPGFDMDRVRRAINLPNNPAAQRYLQAYMQAAGVMRREAEPLEIVEGPDGQPTMVPRSQAVGRRPANRDMAPRSQERFEQDRQIAEASAARSQTTVNAGDRRTDVLVADAWNTAEENARDAGRRNVLFRRAEAAMQGFQPGILAERRLWLGQMARELGIRTPGTTEGEVLQQVQRQLELAATPRGQGAITENERGLVREAVPLLLRSPEGARAAIALLRQLDDYEMQIARIYRENARRHGGQPDPASVREEIAAFVAQNQPPDVEAVLEQLSGPTQEGRSGVQAEPPEQPVPARPSIVPEGSAYSPSRRQWRTPDGRIFNQDGTPAR